VTNCFSLAQTASWRTAHLRLSHYSIQSQLPSLFPVDRDSSVCIVTPCGLDCPDIKSRWDRNTSHLSRLALGPTQPPIKCVLVIYRGVNRPWRGVDHPPHLAPRFKKEWIYISTAPLCLDCLFYGDLYLYLVVSVHSLRTRCIWRVRDS